MSGFYTLPPDAPFLDTLAKYLLNRASGDGFALSDTLVLLPTRRACRELRAAFLRQMQGAATLLPRLQPLGDSDEEELYFTGDAALAADLPPAISPLRRQFLLAQLIRGREPDMPLEQAMQLAAALARLLDEAQLMRCDLAKLEALVQERDLAAHWQETVRFLSVLTEAWPAVLAAEGALDPADRRNRVAAAQIAQWQAAPPPFPVVAAGSTGSLPATAELLHVIAGLDLGMVILPGYDEKACPLKATEAESHPQFGLQKLLAITAKMPLKTRVLEGYLPVLGARLALLREAARPAETTDAWRELRPADFTGATDGLSRLDLDHPQEEAAAIALMLRAALEVPGKTAALVTPDRGLAERVSALLARWGIAVNDTAGAALALSPAGGFLLALLDAATPPAGPVECLALLKHPYAALGQDPAVCRAAARAAELKLRQGDADDVTRRTGFDAAKDMLRPLADQWALKKTLGDWLALHRAAAEACAASDIESGADRLWRGEDGEALAALLDEWNAASVGLPPLSGDEYQALFNQLLRDTVLRPHRGAHPRLNILGLLEARLLHFDLVILGGLNEGVWPPQPPPDPWMSRPMKSAFGLSTPERRVGLSAHDFNQLAALPEVVLTRARRAGGAPTVPSRFLLQLDAVLKAAGISTPRHDPLAPPLPWRDWLRAMDVPREIAPIARPSPRPPAALRPMALSVTDIGLWQRNPYAIYAKHVLRLQPLEPLVAEVDAAARGGWIHAALEAFTRRYPAQLPPQAVEELLAIGRELFTAYDSAPEIRAFWWPRFARIAPQFVAHQARRLDEGSMVLAVEAKGVWEREGFRLTGRVDRIDRLADGTLDIIDYKTGHVPGKEEVAQGIEPQLPLLALLAERGCFKDIGAAAVAGLLYWKNAGGRGDDRPQQVKVDVGAAIAAAERGLRVLVETFADPATPYQAVPKPGRQPRYDDYAHLARIQEWGARGEEG